MHQKTIERERVKMFLSNLSSSVLRLCDSRALSYKAVSELCDVSARHVSNIVRCKTALSIPTLEKLCHGFEVTPNDLLMYPSGGRREPMLVTHFRCQGPGLPGFPICPRCGRPLERAFQNFCDHCGQRLDWRALDKARPIFEDP